MPVLYYVSALGSWRNCGSPLVQSFRDIFRSCLIFSLIFLSVIGGGKVSADTSAVENLDLCSVCRESSVSKLELATSFESGQPTIPDDHHCRQHLPDALMLMDPRSEPESNPDCETCVYVVDLIPRPTGARRSRPESPDCCQSHRERLHLQQRLLI